MSAQQQQLFESTFLRTSQMNAPTLVSYDMNSPIYPADSVKLTIPALVKGNDRGLAGVSVETLRSCLQPVLEGLQHIDAEALLNLKRVSPVVPQNHRSGSVVDEGSARLREGVNVRPIHDEIQPPCDEGTVRYIHLSEIPGQYSMGIFVFPPNSKIPLHDHPGMCVLSRVLYGDLQRLSLDLVRDKDDDLKDALAEAESAQHQHEILSEEQPEEDQNSHSNSSCSSYSPKSNGSKKRSKAVQQQSQQPAIAKDDKTSRWLPNWAKIQEDGNISTNDSWSVPITQQQMRSFPVGTKRAYKHHVDHLQAPACTVLYPYEGNLHEFTAGPQGAAVLDVLLPPYDVDHHRDCTFYTIHELRGLTETQHVTLQQQQQCKLSNQHEPCLIIPTGQPEDFHCISGEYMEIGAGN